MKKLDKDNVKKNMITFKVSNKELNAITTHLMRNEIGNRSDFIRTLVLNYIGEN